MLIISILGWIVTTPNSTYNVLSSFIGATLPVPSVHSTPIINFLTYTKLMFHLWKQQLYISLSKKCQSYIQGSSPTNFFTFSRIRIFTYYTYLIYLFDNFYSIFPLKLHAKRCKSACWSSFTSTILKSIVGMVYFMTQANLVIRTKLMIKLTKERTLQNVDFPCICHQFICCSL